MILRFARPVFALLALILVAAPAARGQTKAGIVTTVEGSATAARIDLPQPVALKFKDDVFQNDRIVTGDRSLVRVLLGGKAVVTVRERSALTITETPGRSAIHLGIGKIAVAVAKEKMRPGESLEVRTPNAVAAIRGTVFVVEVIRATAQAGTTTSGGVTTNIYGLSGFVSVDFSGRVVNLAPNQFVTGTGTAPPSLQVMTPEDRSQALSGLTANPQHVSAGQEDAKDQAMGTTVATFGASPPDPQSAPPPPPIDTCGGGACPEDLIKTEVAEAPPPQETTLTSPLCCPPSSRGHLTFNGTTEGEPMFLLSGGTLTVGTEQDPVNLFDVTGTATAVDATTGLTVGTETPLQPPGGSPVFQDPVSSVTVHGSAFRVDTALLEATAPLLKLTADSTFEARVHAVNLAGRAKVSIPNDAVAMISLDKSILTTGSHLVNVAGGSVLNVAGSLVSLANGSTLTVNGVLLNVSGGSHVTLGTLVSFSGTGNRINVTNNLIPTIYFRGGIPVPVSGGAANFTMGIPFSLGNGNVIRINGVQLTTTTDPTRLTGSLMAVQGSGKVTITGQ